MKATAWGAAGDTCNILHPCSYWDIICNIYICIYVYVYAYVYVYVYAYVYVYVYVRICICAYMYIHPIKSYLGVANKWL